MPTIPTMALLEKYSQPGPRYTSYPTAPHFDQSFRHTQWKNELEAGYSLNKPLSLYFHIPFCDTLCYFCGCNMIATQRYQRVPQYLNTLRREMEAVSDLVGQQRPVQQLHWGGGTPTFLNPDDIYALSTDIRQCFGQQGNFDKQAEISCEIDPRELTFEHLQALRESGFNRVSFGVQDLNEQVQRAVNRIQPEHIVRQVFDWAHHLGFSSINLDLMTGLPHQTTERFNHTLDIVLELSPDRLAVFAYAHLPNMIKHQSMIADETLPDFKTRLQLQLLVRERLTAAGYVNIGMDHYAKPSDELVLAQNNRTLWRNFQGYTTHKECDILGFGVSAISQTETIYCQNQKKINDYEASVAQHRFATMRGIRLSRRDLVCRDAIARIMCHLVLDIAAFERKWQINFSTAFATTLQQLKLLEDDGLLDMASNKITVTPIGIIFVRNIAMTFDEYLPQKDCTETVIAVHPRSRKTGISKAHPSFSKTV